jgi:hypothetical protein
MFSSRHVRLFVFVVSASLKQVAAKTAFFIRATLRFFLIFFVCDAGISYASDAD